MLRFNPTSRLLVSGSADNTVRLIAIPEGLGDNGAFYTYAVCRVGLTVDSLLSVVELHYHNHHNSILCFICRRTSTLHARCYLGIHFESEEFVSTRIYSFATALTLRVCYFVLTLIGPNSNFAILIDDLPFRTLLAHTHKFSFP